MEFALMKGAYINKQTNKHTASVNTGKQIHTSKVTVAEEKSECKICKEYILQYMPYIYIYIYI